MAVSMDRLQSVQAVRGFAALVVVLFHAAMLTVDYMPTAGGGGILYQPWMLIGKAGVDLFFVVSGFIMVYTTSSRFDQAGSAERFAIARISRIYPPYWILSLFVFAYWLHNPAGVNSKNGGVDPIASFLLLPSSSLPLVPVAWTLIYEMFFYLMFFAAIALIKRAQLVTLLVVWGIAAAINTAIGNFASTRMIGGLLLSPFNLEFIGGALLAHHMGKSSGRLVVAIGALWMAGIAAYFQAVGYPENIHVARRVVMFAPPCLAFVYGLIAMETRGWLPSKWIVSIGNWSYSIYLVHILVLHLIYRVATRKMNIEWNLQNSLALATVASLISIVSGFIYFMLIEKRSTSAFSRMLRFVVEWRPTKRKPASPG